MFVVLLHQLKSLERAPAFWTPERPSEVLLLMVARQRPHVCVRGRTVAPIDAASPSAGLLGHARLQAEVGALEVPAGMVELGMSVPPEDLLAPIDAAARRVRSAVDTEQAI